MHLATPAYFADKWHASRGHLLAQNFTAEWQQVQEKLASVALPAKFTVEARLIAP